MAEIPSAHSEHYSDSLTVKEIVHTIVSSPLSISFHLSGRLKRNKAYLIEKLLADDSRWAGALESAIKQKTAVGRLTRRDRRARQAERQRNERNVQGETATEGFLEVPSESQVVECYQRFHDATSNDALKLFVCGVCARLLNEAAEKASTMPLDEIPNRDRLQPLHPHPAHVLTKGCLLERNGCTHNPNEDTWTVDVCQECHKGLKSDRSSNPPKYSLANELWVGDVPWELCHLTLAEQLLIARVYPRVFVVKLFPKSNGRHGLSDSQLQSGMRGNVTTFELNSDAIADMIAGNLMPQPPSVLSNVLSVTFISRKATLHPASLCLFQVRQHNIVSALRWLKANNPRYYGDIQIDESRLALLPEDSVPREVLMNIHHEHNETIIDSESDGYVPPENVGEEENAPEGTQGMDIDGASASPDVVPIQFLGVMDNDMTKIPTNELMRWGLENLQQNKEESGYAVRHGQPINTFGWPPIGNPSPDPNRPNYWEMAFPLLYPYGVGGIESDRPTPLSLIEHVRWSLRYHDRRFRIHPTFSFVACSIYQRRQTMTLARIQMYRRDFDSVARTLSSITLEDLQKAADEEARGQPHSNPAIRILKRHIQATSSRVIGSDASRFQLRNQIWSTIVCFGPPILWLTINPDDLHDPIAQLLAGKEIDMNNFSRTAGPDKLRRSQNIARDPVAAAEFFHFMVSIILEHLFGIKATASRVHSGLGVLGRIQSYFGTVECQGRGTLHLHMLLWLAGAPSTEQLKTLLQTVEFKSKVTAFLRANIRTYLPELSNTSQLSEVPPDAEVAYSRLPNPSSPQDIFLQALRELEVKVARTKQVHACVQGRCLRWDRNGQLVCKRGAPWDLSETDTVKSDGTVQTKQTLGYLNGYCPAIAVAARCNNDIKILLHGTGTNNLTWYITGYIAKKQGRSYNASALLADHLLYHFADEKYNNNLREQQRLFLLRAVNVLNREQEMAAPLAVSYLMGWGDVYRSHHYTPILWGSFVSLIHVTYPTLRTNHTNRTAGPPESFTQADGQSQDKSGSTVVSDEHSSEQVVLEFDRQSILRPRSLQVDDYMHRGEELASYNVLDYFTSTYEQPKKKRRQTTINSSQDMDEDNEHQTDPCEEEPTRQRGGRPRHHRVQYTANHPKHETHERVVRPEGHNTLPNFIGPRFPHAANPDQADSFAASALTLLKPWRSLYDLKSQEQGWQNALDNFLALANPLTRNTVTNMQHYHTCRVAADQDQPDIPETSQPNSVDEDDSMDETDATVLPAGPRILTSNDITPQMLTEARNTGESKRDATYGRQAVQIGSSKGFFTCRTETIKPTAVQATQQDLDKLKNWQDTLHRSLVTTAGTTTENTLETSQDDGDVAQLNASTSSSARLDTGEVLPQEQILEQSIDAASYEELFPEQQRAFDIIRWHLNKTNDATGRLVEPPPQLLMLLIGEGGTGKSKVIQTVSAEFERRGQTRMLLKSAYTGIAASLIDGKTTHNIGCISVNGNDLSEDGKQKLARLWKDVQYLILDECSMLSKQFFGQLSRHIATAKLAGRSVRTCGPSAQPAGASSTSKSQSSESEKPFGGVNVILCGDFHQFPPVACSPRSALYHPNSRAADSDLVCLGGRIYAQFKTVVVLRHQVRVSDPEWRELLSCLRAGKLEARHLALLHELVLTNPRCIQTDFESDTWEEASLVTTRHCVRKRWNDAAVKRHCQRTGNQLFHCAAYDTIDGHSLSPVEQYIAIKSATGKGSSKDQRKSRLPESISLAVGMRIMVTLNVETDLDLANGARGTIVGIYLDPREPPFDEKAPEVALKYLPICILVKMARTRAATLPGLEPGVLPIVPASKPFRIITTERKRGKLANVRKSVRRCQFPITPAYAFTDYRSQGQTISSVIVDIAKPPTGSGLNLFNTYVALSRSSGRRTIRLLRDFDERALMQPLDVGLAAEDRRLDELDAETRSWWDQIRTRP